MRDTQCSLLDPDEVWVQGSSIKAVVELKTPWAFDFPDADLITDWVKDDQIERAVCQLYGYMSFNYLRYGILSNYDCTWFFHRIPHHPGGGIEISRCVSRNELIKTFSACLLMVNDDPFYPTSKTSPNLLKVSPITEESRYELTEIKANQFKFLRDQILGSARFGTVIRGQLAGSTKVFAFKTVDISKKNGLAAEMDAEVNIYRHLDHLQGTVIPKFHGYVDFNGLFRALVLEDCGDEISKEDLEEYKAELRSHLEKIHEAGILHGDIETRKSKKSVQLRIIDFSHSKYMSQVPKRERRKELSEELKKFT